MTCREREEDLLLWEAGELSGLRRTALALHVARCPRCRARRAALASTMDAYARAIHPKSRRPAPPRPGVPLPYVVVGVVLFALATGAVVMYRALIASSAPTQPAPCRPGLASDACQ